MLRWRLPLGLLLIVAFVGLSWLDWALTPPAGLLLAPFALVISILASGELLSMFRSNGLAASPTVVYAGNSLIVASNLAPYVWGRYTPSASGNLACPLWALTIAFACAVIEEMRRYQRPGGILARLGLTTFCLVYAGLLTSFLVQIRMADGGRAGMGLLVALIATVKLGDIGAYTVGRAFGRRKLAPLVSPGKTYEGAAGGLAFSCVGAWLALGWLMPEVSSSPGVAPAWGWLPFGILVGVAGMVGDLAESLIKRDLGRKDSSAWLPGFGGVLDLIDSLLFAAPVAYACWAVGLVG